MKSFRQYILEVATDKPKDIKFVHEKEPLGVGSGNHVHNYHIRHPNKQNYKVTMHTRNVKGEKVSMINFASPEGYTGRTGRMANWKDKHSTGVGKASKVLSQVHHVVKHHIKTETPDRISFVADKHEEGGENPSARHDIYRKMARRSAGKLGYEHAPEIDKGGITQHYVRKKKK